MLHITRILVPTDFSAASDMAVEYALDMASRYGCSIDLLHVLDDLSFASAYPDGLAVALPGVRERLAETANEHLAAIAARCAAAHIPAKWHVLVGRPARAIAEKATDRGADLIVMGTHGRGGFTYLILGSVAEHVLRMAPCPVLVVRDTARVADKAAVEATIGSQTWHLQA